MQTAYIKNGCLWKRVPLNSVIDHDGEYVILDTDNHEEAIPAIQALEPDKQLSFVHWLNGYMAADYPFVPHYYFKSTGIPLITQGQKVLTDIVHGWVDAKRGGKYKVAGVSIDPDGHLDGVVAEPYATDNEEHPKLWLVSLNPQAWEEASKKLTKQRAKKKQNQEAGIMTHAEILSMARELTYSVGFPLRDSTPRGLIAGIILTDSLTSDELTYQKLARFAKKWLINKEENTKKCLEKNWLTAKDLELLNKRLEQIKTN